MVMKLLGTILDSFGSPKAHTIFLGKNAHKIFYMQCQRTQNTLKPILYGCGRKIMRGDFSHFHPNKHTTKQCPEIFEQLVKGFSKVLTITVLERECLLVVKSTDSETRLVKSGFSTAVHVTSGRLLNCFVTMKWG